LTAKLATTVDHLSGGRFVLGLGGGWFEPEHDAFGLDFGSGFGERLDRLDESAGLIRRLLDGERVSHEGPFYAMHDAVCAPLPIQERLPILIGGSGPNKTLRTTARHADLWNGFGAPDRIAQVSEVLHDRCAQIGRAFDEIERTVTIHAVIRDTEPAATDAWAEIARHHGIVGRVAADGTERGLTVGGSPTDVARYLAGYREAGISEVIIVFRAPFDEETIGGVGELREAVAALG
jgi:alkanesulfonate monooxygenase SsuD/methylene tetrahydromethanopterin reductase-like flavin-dependent oxidoreductase (luciferase family)